MSSSGDNLALPQRRLAALAPLILGAAVAAVAMVGRTKLGAWVGGFLSVPRQRHAALSRPLFLARPLPELRDSILGMHKRAILERYGVPRSAALAHVIVTDTTAAAALRADTWYYLLDPTARCAMSIRFDGHAASAVEFFDAPAA